MPFATSQEPREAILDAAADLFFERGFAQTGMNAIGERIGVSGPALYAHFKSKDEILATLALEGVHKVLASAGTPLSDPRADLEHLVANHVDEMLGDRRITSVYVTEKTSLRPELVAPIAAGLEDYRQRWVDAVRRRWPDRPDDRIIAAANAAMGIAYAVVLWPPEALTAERLPQMLTDMTLRALAVLDDPA